MRILKSKFIDYGLDEKYLISYHHGKGREVSGATHKDIQECLDYKIPCSAFKLNVWPPPLKVRKGDVVKVVQGRKDIPHGSLYLIWDKSKIPEFAPDFKNKPDLIGLAMTGTHLYINPDLFNGGLNLFYRRFR